MRSFVVCSQRVDGHRSAPTRRHQKSQRRPPGFLFLASYIFICAFLKLLKAPSTKTNKSILPRLITSSVLAS
uniref:Uncharacterized protein n=1 Tax=Arundo donax TaxID=35708 RepID=A0A0A9GFK4_ARUDO